MKKILIIVIQVLFIGQVGEKKKKTKSEKLETTDYYTFELSEKVTRQKVK